MDFMGDDKDEDGGAAYPLITEEAKGELPDSQAVLAYVPITVGTSTETYVLPGWTTTIDGVQNVVFFYTTLWDRLGVPSMESVLVGGTRLRRAVCLEKERSSGCEFATLFEGDALKGKIAECINALYDKDTAFKTALDKAKGSHKAGQEAPSRVHREGPNNSHSRPDPKRLEGHEEGLGGLERSS